MCSKEITSAPVVQVLGAIGSNGINIIKIERRRCWGIRESGAGTQVVVGFMLPRGPSVHRTEPFS